MPFMESFENEGIHEVATMCPQTLISGGIGFSYLGQPWQNAEG